LITLLKREKQTQVRNVRKSKANFHFKGTANNKKKLWAEVISRKHNAGLSPAF